MDESEKIENVQDEKVGEEEHEGDLEEDVEGYDEGDEEHVEDDEEHVEEDDGEGADDANECVDEEEEEDEHEIDDIEGDDEDVEGDDDGDGEGEEEEEGGEVAVVESDKKVPKPIESIGNFDAVDDPEIKSILQKTTIKLYDGTTHVMLSRGPKYSDEKWPINCHICFESGFNIKSLKAHLKSPRHENILRWRPSDPKYQHMKAFRQPFDDDDPTLTPILIYPGEVITEITPELIDRIISKEETVPAEYAGLIGLCYAYKVKRYKQDHYECTLCRKAVSIGHFKTQKHIDKYIDCHFPKTWKTVRNMLTDAKLGWKVDMSLLRTQQIHIREVVRKIYKKIEDERGPRQPKSVKFRDFNINRGTFEKQARNKKHYDEKMVTITDEWLTELLKETHEKLLKDKVLKTGNQRDETSRGGRGSRSKDRGRLVGDSRKTLARPRIVENDPKAWDRYRRMVGAIMDDLEDLYNRKYRKNLESHPNYKSEWKKFWHSRANDLERDGIDPHTYDFNKEWIPYWQKRLDELHAKEIASEKFVTKRKLNLPYDMGSPSPVRRRRRSSPRRTSPQSRQRPARRRTPSPGEHRPKRRRGDNDGPLTVCGVLRLVSALEDNLGSLGPQGVQLLSRAILTEKNNPNPDSLLMENEFYIFFMTAKEKLKGQLLANIVEPRKIDAVNRAVNQISAIIRRYEDLRARHNNGRNQQAHIADDGHNQQFNDNGPNNRYPNQFSGGNRGGVWHSGNYRGENMGGGGGMGVNQGMPPQNQNFNRPMPSMNFGGGNMYPNQSGGNNYNNRDGNSMNAPAHMGGGGNRQMGAMPPPQYGGRMDSNNGGGSSSYGSNNAGNYGGMGGGGAGNGSGPVGNQYGGNYQGKRNFDGNETFGGSSFRADNQRDNTVGINAPPAPSYGPTRGRAGNVGGFQNKGDILSGGNMNMSRNANQMVGGTANRQSGGRPMDFNENMNRGGNNQMPVNRRMNQSDNQDHMGGGGQQAYGNASGGSRPWSSGYNQSGNSNYKGGNAENTSRGQYNTGGPDYAKKSTEMQSAGGGNYGSGGMPMRGGGGGGGGNWNSGDFNNQGNQGFNNRSSQINPPQLNRNMNIGGQY